ncbi:MAG: TolC family protein [Candidatus Omnitrophica bacterium]|nr:TolC family protein [Candidatus Omnitrophota bacterium]MDD5566283.1 TolC family protein [Candidatus Omnitrophota bacterium]
MRKLLNILLINTLIFGPFLPAFAADKKSADEEKTREIEKALFMAAGAQDRVLRIGLVDCIAYALKNNSEILIKRIEPKIKEDDVRIAKADFEPTFSADYTLRDNTKASTSTLYPGTSKTRDIDFNIGASGKLITGTEYDIDFLNERYKSSVSTQSPNPYYTTEPKITITQPLFRNFGILVNKADIIVAQNNRLQSSASFKDTVMDTISKSKTAYYNYIFYLESYAIAKLSLERAQHLLEINRARYQKGLVSSVDLLETEAAAAQREKAVLAAETQMKKAEDDLKLITNLVDDPEVWNAKIELIDKPEFKVEEVDLLQSLKSAFEYRPDYYSAKIDLKSRDIKIATSKNALLPTVDLIGSFGLNGLGKDYQDALEKVDSDYTDWSVGVKFSLPWGSGDRAKYDQKKLEKAQALLSFRRLEQNIILEIRDKVRLVKTQKQQVDVAKLSKEKETQNYEAQKERYAAGQVSTHDMLDYQDKLSQAELDYVKSLIDYNVTLINLDKSQGLTLAKNDIKLEE